MSDPLPRRAAGLVRDGASSVADRGARTIRHAVDEYRHRVPKIRTTQLDGPGRILFLTPDWKRPAGGIRTIYRHVDLLNRAGVPAAVLHARPGFRCTWFDNDTPVVNLKTTVLCRSDILVVPEVHGALLDALPPVIAHVVFNQSGHLTWAHEPERVSRHYRNSRSLLGVVTVSEHSTQLLSYAFPRLPVTRVHLGVDADRYHLGPGERPRQISYMPRRARADSVQVLQILASRGGLRGWDLIQIDGMSEREVADALRRSRVFLNFSHQEGFGLPVAEAMASGCYVVGSHGFGGRELFQPEFSSPVPPGDVLAFAQAVEAALVQDDQDPGWCATRGAMASQFVLREYSSAREAAEVVGFYRNLLAR